MLHSFVLFYYRGYFEHRLEGLCVHHASTPTYESKVHPISVCHCQIVHFGLFASLNHSSPLKGPNPKGIQAAIVVLKPFWLSFALTVLALMVRRLARLKHSGDVLKLTYLFSLGLINSVAPIVHIL